MRRPVVLIGLLALAACGRPSPHAAQAAAPLPTSAEAPHNWVSVRGREYSYYPNDHDLKGSAGAEVQATAVRYLGRGRDGAYAIVEAGGGTVTQASCLMPCTQVRTRRDGLDQTAPIGGDSVTRAALDDAINGRLEVYPPTPGPHGPQALK